MGPPLLDISSPISIRAQWARQHAVYGIQEEWNKLVRLAYGRRPDDERSDLPELMDGDTLDEAPLKTIPKDGKNEAAAGDPLAINVGIVGAGAAGLFSALVLEHLNTAQSSVKFTYDILEADTTNRSGGRLYTHNFSQQPHDYFDVGAMRFPKHAVMDRVFSLFTDLGMGFGSLDPKGNWANDPPLGTLIPYYLTNIDPTTGVPQEPWRFNNVNSWGSYSSIATETEDPWSFSADKTLQIDHRLLALKMSPGDIMTALLEPIRQQLRDDIKNQTNTGWQTLMSFDRMTMTQFLSSPWPGSLPQPSLPSPMTGNVPLPPYNYDTIQWFETFNGGTNWYDQAFSEIVLESLDFDFPKPGDPAAEWYCILGGAQQLATKMEARVNALSGNPSKVEYSSRVTALVQVEAMKVNVDINGGGSQSKSAHGSGGGGETRSYSCVFNTTPLGCLEHMDTTAVLFNSATRQAVRSLGYGPSCKVAIKFTRPWWIHNLPAATAVKRGGLGHSDLNIRTCVYPSYNIYDADSVSAVLLCTYTWQQDAQRLGSLMGDNDDDDETQLRTLLLDDLVRLHAPSDATPKQLADLHSLVHGSYHSHFAWDWYKDPNAAGAFAFFRPFQFSDMWGKMIIPAGDVVVMGEHASPHHAWVVGALESAVHGIAAWCSMTATHSADHAAAMKAVLDVLTTTNDPDSNSNPYVGLPPYMDLNMELWHGCLGAAVRQGMLEDRQEPLGRLTLNDRAAADKKRAAALLTKLGIEGGFAKS
ncbi:putative bifunctional amine oxidase [Colletotrichum tanaceti]|uniref:Putative bifunctional amine oxidase n=1 Tax=Colletotrichum tanaceti TaxID=1306861 RepID=A0A4U6XU88_9PEZI|nr:putative bifunctional amine oxidase [Colletotrichum tanaceti]TKW59471.1 putative bifunctional amine oxidase [Colletotrichum tanaceti]